MNTISDLNLNNIKSDLVEALRNNGSLDNAPISNIFNHLIDDFNNRNFNKENMDEMLYLFDYLQIDNIMSFVIIYIKNTFNETSLKLSEKKLEKLKPYYDNNCLNLICKYTNRKILEYVHNFID